MSEQEFLALESTDSTSSSRWLCLNFYGMALDLLRLNGVDVKSPCAVLEGPENRRFVAFSSPSATQRGVRVGQPLAQAQSFVPELRTYVRDTAQEQHTLSWLAQWAYGYSSQVAIYHTGGERMLLIEIGASAKLFGKQLLSKLRVALADFGLTARFGSGDSDSAARAASRIVGAGKLYPHRRFESIRGQLPLTLTEIDAQICETLAGCGISTLGELLQLPIPELAQRFGKALVAHIEWLLARRISRLTLYQPPANFSSSLSLLAPAHNTQMLLFPLRRLLHALSVVLQGRDRAVVALTLTMGLEKRRDMPKEFSIALQLAQAGRNPDHLFSLFKTRLDALQLPAPALSMTLSADALVEFAPASADLLDPKHAAVANWPQVLERLRARLGNAALATLALHADHRPEKASRLAELLITQQTSERGVQNKPQSALQENHPQLQRPLWLLATALSVTRSDFELLSGAERIECGWWDDQDIRRDYYRARDRFGVQCWLFEDLSRPGTWFVQGLDFSN